MTGKKSMVAGKTNNVIRIPTSISGNFFKHWLAFLSPFHNMSERELEIAALLLKERFELSKVVSDPNIVDKVLFNDETRAKLRQQCGLKPAYFQILLARLKKAKFIVDNRINPKFIPKALSQEDNSFQLLIYFDLGNE